MTYKVSKGARSCAACEKPFEPEQELHSALFEAADSLRREDFCPACWGPGRDEAFCHWRTRFQPDEKKPVFDQDRVLTVFDQVTGDGSDARDRLRYLVALMLVRKRVFRLLGPARVEGEEAIRVHCPERDEEYRVRDPGFTAAEIEEAQAELSGLLDIAP